MAPVIGLSAFVSVMFDRFVQFVVRMNQLPLAIIVRLGPRNWCQNQSCRKK